MRRDKPYEFHRKGHEEQYRFNLGIVDHVAAATTQLDKIQPASEKDKAMLDKARKELEEGACALVKCQKHIRIADQFEHSWEMVVAYVGHDVAANEDDDRRIEKAEKTAEQRVSKRKRKAAATITSQETKRPFPSSVTQPQGPPKPAPFLLPRPSYGHPSTARPVGLCWACGEVGHLKTTYLRLSKSYPFMYIDKSDSGGPSKVSDYPCSQDRKVNVGICPSTVVGSSPESVERETSHGMVQGSMLKQGVNFPSDRSDTVTQTSKGIDTVMAEAWEAQCETS